MNSLTTVGSEGINDPNFLYILGAQVLLFLTICTVCGWVINRIIVKYKPNLNVAIRLILTIFTVIALIGIVGYISELLGL